MKDGQFMALVKSGQKEFIELNIEGSFVNEDLSNLLFRKCFFEADFTGANFSKTVFEECNFKMCLFNYCNLEKSTFNCNSLECTDFKFAQYNDLIFKDNLAYGANFTKEILEDVRYKNYPGFHIVRVKAGWFDVILVDEFKTIVVTASCYLGNDAPYELLKSLNEICEEKFKNPSITKLLCWDDEPGTFIWKLMLRNSKIELAVYSVERNSYDIISEHGESLENEEIFNTEIEIEGEFLGFIKEVAKSFEKIRFLKKGKHYEKEWGSFPVSELEKLKSFISAIKRS